MNVIWMHYTNHVTYQCQLSLTVNHKSSPVASWDSKMSNIYFRISPEVLSTVNSDIFCHAVCDFRCSLGLSAMYCHSLLWPWPCMWTTTSNMTFALTYSLLAFVLEYSLSFPPHTGFVPTDVLFVQWRLL